MYTINKCDIASWAIMIVCFSGFVVDMFGQTTEDVVAPSIVLKHYEDNVAKIRSAILTYRISDGQNSSPAQMAYINLDQQQTKILSKIIDDQNIAHCSETICDKERYVSLNHNDNTDKESEIALLSVLNIVPDTWKDNLRNEYCSLLFGIVPEIPMDSGDLNVILEKSNKSTHIVKNNNNFYVVLEAVTTEAVIQMIFEKKDLQLKKIDIRIPQMNKVAGSLNRMICEIDQYVTLDEISVPSQYSFFSYYTGKIPQESEKSSKEVIDVLLQRNPRLADSKIVKRQITFENIEINKKIPKAISTFSKNIPDYTPVNVLDAPQIRHVWLDGKVVPWTDEQALARARGHRFISGPDEPRFWLMAMGLAMIIFALSTKIYNYIQSKKGNE